MNTAKQRPYWHVDMKWVCGILAFVSLWGALLMNAFATLSERENATAITSSAVTNILKTNGVDPAPLIAQLKAQAAFLPDGAVMSLPNYPGVKVSKADLLAKTNEQLQQLVAEQVTSPIYDQGLDAAAAQLTTDQTQQQSLKQQLGLLGVMSKQTHDALAVASKVVFALSFLWFAGLIYFSAGWGRLASPGVVLVLVSPVGVMIGRVFEFLSKKNDSFLSFLPQSVLTSIATAINGTYRTAMFGGFALLLIAGIGALITRGRNSPAKA